MMISWEKGSGDTPTTSPTITRSSRTSEELSRRRSSLFSETRAAYLSARRSRISSKARSRTFYCLRSSRLTNRPEDEPAKRDGGIRSQYGGGRPEELLVSTVVSVYY